MKAERRRERAREIERRNEPRVTDQYVETLESSREKPTLQTHSSGRQIIDTQYWTIIKGWHSLFETDGLTDWMLTMKQNEGEISTDFWDTRKC